MDVSVFKQNLRESKNVIWDKPHTNTRSNFHVLPKQRGEPYSVAEQTPVVLVEHEAVVEVVCRGVLWSPAVLPVLPAHPPQPLSLSKGEEPPALADPAAGTLPDCCMRDRALRRYGLLRSLGAATAWQGQGSLSLGFGWVHAAQLVHHTALGAQGTLSSSPAVLSACRACYGAQVRVS